MDWQLALQLMLCNEPCEHSQLEAKTRICVHEIYNNICIKGKYPSHSIICETKYAFLKAWHSCSICKIHGQVPPKAVSGDTAALCCEKPVPGPGTVLPDFDLELCWDIAGVSQPDFVSSMGTGGAEEVSREWCSLAGWKGWVWGMRHLTSQRGMGTEGERTPEYEPFWGEITQERILALQKY